MNRCWDCGKQIKRGYIRCEKCVKKPIKLTNAKVNIWKRIPGYNSPGYNRGLGKVIKTKRQWLNEQKKLGVQSSG